MKKRILLIITILLFTTGCTCQYNLTIEGNVYKEEIILTGETSEEINTFNKKWKVPVDKEIYNLGLDPSSQSVNESDIYNYKLTGSKLKFNYEFTKNGYANSSAVSNCYNKLTVSNYGDSIILSTNTKVECFDKYPPLTSINVNVKVDKPVISHNADRVNGNVYIWNITKSNKDDKSINLVLNNEESNNIPQEPSNQDKNNQTNNKIKKDYTMIIFGIVLLVVMLTVYFMFNKLKNKSDNMDD